MNVLHSTLVASANALEAVVSKLLGDVRVVEPADAWTRKRDVRAAWRGVAKVAGEDVVLEIGIAEPFPLRLPWIAVDPTGSFRGLPHVEADGVVCYRDRANSVVDPDIPGEVVSDAILYAIATLEHSFGNARVDEFVRELGSYWSQLVAARPRDELSEAIPATFDGGEDAKCVFVVEEAGRSVALVEAPADLMRFRASTGPTTIRNGLYLPITIPVGDTSFRPSDLATAEGLRRYVVPSYFEVPSVWREILRHIRRRSRSATVVLGVSSSGQRRALVGLEVRVASRLDHPLLPASLGAARIRPFMVAAASAQALLIRGGASNRYAAKRVLLVGCGAVGGHIAYNLAKAGVGRIAMVDSDVFTYANTFRHVCGRAQVGVDKVVGLKSELQRLWPYVEVESHHGEVHDLLERGLVRPAGVDLVVSAVGSPTVDMMLNRWLRATSAAPPILHSWLEPLGVGGHALLSYPGRRACIDCLYAEPARGCRVAFAEKGEHFARDGGCGGEFLPHGDMDSQRTAELASRLALDALRGRCSSAEVRSWKGAAEDFLEQGGATTDRYSLVSAESVVRGIDLAMPNCRVCGES